MKKKIVFLTGTRADFGKIKPLIEALHSRNDFEVHIFVTGMHMDNKYGYTVREIEKCGYPNIYKYINYSAEQFMDVSLATTIHGFSDYARMINPDLIIVHGDRVEALAGASVGAINNILVAHIEGGEISGTVDELIRHAVSKLSHTHFVANGEAKNRLLQMGEASNSIFEIGSPDMDAMLSENLPPLSEVKEHYGISFGKYAISIFHPVTTEINKLSEHAKEYFNALTQTNHNYILIYPNNDIGSGIILNELTKLENGKRFHIFPSIRFENFLCLLKNASFIIGNSSAGIREAPFFGVPVVNVGSRQNGRSNNTNIIHCTYDCSSIINGINKADEQTVEPQQLFGKGNSVVHFLDTITSESFWSTAMQKVFRDRFPATAAKEVSVF